MPIKNSGLVPARQDRRSCARESTLDGLGGTAVVSATIPERKVAGTVMRGLDEAGGAVSNPQVLADCTPAERRLNPSEVKNVGKIVDQCSGLFGILGIVLLIYELFPNFWQLP
jgi:hypothetical protein